MPTRKAVPDQPRPAEEHVARGLGAGARTDAPGRIRIESPWPMIDCGRYPAKRCVGDQVDVHADVIRDGHEVIRAVVRYRAPDSREWRESPMRRIDAHVDGDRWAGSFDVTEMGRWRWTVEAWTDPFAGWRDELMRKVEFGQHDLAGELSEGLVLLRDAAERAAGGDRQLIETAASVLADEHLPDDAKHEQALGPELAEAVERHPDRSAAVRMDTELEIEVDRERARFASWYELFPRSWGGFAGVEKDLPRFAELGFDVLYLPPIHPIGHTNRKGANNALVAGPDDPGSPWAIGSDEGGHTAVHPDLGTIEDFDRLVARANELDIEIALDFAIQCSADHPWLSEHPDWFHRRPDGTIKYAENPPKRYQDIHNVNFDSPDWEGLWQALLDVVLHWVDHGVRIFRVDNPHTKPLPFWEWMIAEVRSRHPEVIFLAEAFTRRAMMRTLAKVGFSQSYTYFTWKNTRWDLREYVEELARISAEYFRPNFFPNTPDILNAYLQHGGRPAFEARLVLASTLSPTYGVYSGYEHCEDRPAYEGSEEYLDSEKYEVKERGLDGPLLPLMGKLNAARRKNPALQHLSNVTFLETENEALVGYLKRHDGNAVIVIVNIDPRNAQEGLAVVPAALGLPPAYAVEDLLTGERFDWRIGRNYVRLDPGERVAHVFRVES